AGTPLIFYCETAINATPSFMAKALAVPGSSMALSSIESTELDMKTVHLRFYLLPLISLFQKSHKAHKLIAYDQIKFWRSTS
ncbi:MAG: hypothetical protein V7764_12820, partial [Pseudomonas marincola]|uniref:hypothetical protein n=1 Tax=Pseudomonas marincola TaxID=437900 RepID=UPI003001352A